MQSLPTPEPTVLPVVDADDLERGDVPGWVLVTLVRRSKVFGRRLRLS